MNEYGCICQWIGNIYRKPMVFVIQQTDFLLRIRWADPTRSLGRQGSGIFGTAWWLEVF